MGLWNSPDVLLVVHELRRTGVPLTTLPIATVARGRGLRCGLFAKRGGPLLLELEARCEGPIVVAPNRWQRGLDVARHRGLPLRGGFERQVARQVLDQLKPRSVFANSIAAAEVAVEATRTGIPAGVYVHELPPVLTTFVRSLDVRQLRQVTLLANSAATQRAVSDALSVPAGDITVIHPPVSVPEHAPPVPSDPPIVLGVGRVSRVKGTDRFVRVAARVAPSGGARFIWVGVDSFLTRRWAELGVPDSPVEFVGEATDVSRWFRRATIVLIPSRVESFSRVAVEALAHGAIVVAVDVGGVREAVGQAAVLVPEGRNVERRLARAVNDVLNGDQDQQRLLRHLGYRQVERFADDAFETKIGAVLASLPANGS